MQVLGRATGPELGQQVHAACAGPVLIPIACAQPYLGRPVPGEDEDRHRRSSFNRRGGEIAVSVTVCSAYMDPDAPLTMVVELSSQQAHTPVPPWPCTDLHACSVCTEHTHHTAAV